MDIIELSSDSNDTIIIPDRELSSFKDSAFEISSQKEVIAEPRRNTLELFAADTDGDDFLAQCVDTFTLEKKQRTDDVEDANKLLQELHAKYLQTKTGVIHLQETKIANSTQNKDKHTVKRKLSPDENEITKVTKKQLLEDMRNQQLIARQKKKQEIEQEKIKKKTWRTIQKNNSPIELLKNIIVKIDEAIIAKFGDAITKVLRTNDISYKSVKQDHNNIISWDRKAQTIENLITEVQKPDEKFGEKHYFFILPSTEFKTLVSSNNLKNFINSLSCQFEFKHLTIAVFGQSQCNENEEIAVMEVDLFFKCYWQFIKKIDDLASLLFTITKAVAQMPYKLEKDEKYNNQDEFLEGSKKSTVRVDKDGNGLARLWRQMLTTLPLASLETAEAIASIYPTPSALFKAYEECQGELEKQGLLQNIIVKRANTPAESAARKIGPELSKKCAKLFTSLENEYI